MVCRLRGENTETAEMLTQCPRLSELLVFARQLEDIPTASSTTHFSKASGLKHWNEAHEAIAWRTRIDRVRFHDRSAAVSCEFHGSGDDALAHALAAQASNDKKAGNRPNAFVIPAMFDESTVG
jgi:hypothetical protein